MCHLGKTIDENEDGIEVVGQRQVRDEVAGDAFPRDVGDRQRSKFAMCAMTCWFRSGADFAGRNVFFDESVNVGYKVVSGEQFHSLVDSWMSC